MRRFVFAVGAVAWTASLLIPSFAFAQVQHGGAAQHTRVVHPPPQLNVLVIVVDDVGMDQFGAFAAEYPGTLTPCTPHLDQFAAQAVRFTNCWTSPVCTPTRAMLMTGRPASRIGTGTVTKVGAPATNGVPTDIPTIADAFQSMAPGTACTAAVGKWHLADVTQLPQHPLDLGFSGWRGSWFNLNVSPGELPNCFDTSYCDWCKSSVDSIGSLSLPHYTNYATVDTTDDALNVVAQFQGLSTPWFLYVAYNSTHAPFACPQTCAKPCPNTTCGWCTNCPSSGDDVAETRAMTEVLDEEIGRLLAGVDLAKTVVMVISDNGTQPSAVAPPFSPFHAKVSLYQGGINCPLVVWAPRCAITGGRVCNELVSVTDLFATAADFAQIVLPADPLRDSVSLAQYVDDRYDLSGGTPRATVYAEMFEPNFVPDASGLPPPDYVARFHARAVRTAEYKLIERNRYDSTPGTTGNGTSLELYRLGTNAIPDNPAFGPDPFELHDLLDGVAPLDLEAQAAFDQLFQLLHTQHPVLRTGLPSTQWRSAVLDATGATCDSGSLEVSFSLDAQGVPRIARSYLDFDLSSLPAGAVLLGVEADIALQDPATSSMTSLAFVPLDSPSQLYSCDPVQGLFAAASGIPWIAKDHWDSSSHPTSVALGQLANQRTQQLVCDASSLSLVPILSLGLRLADEASPTFDRMTLVDPFGMTPQLLRVFYASSAQQNCP